jgi:hypothetical protein
MIKERGHCCNGLHPLWHSAKPSESGLAHLALSARGEIGESPHSPPACGSSAEFGRPAMRGQGRRCHGGNPGGGVLICGIGSRRVHRGGLAVVKQVSGGEPVTAGRRRGGGRQLIGRRGARCQWEARGGGHRGNH